MKSVIFHCFHHKYRNSFMDSKAHTREKGNGFSLTYLTGLTGKGAAVLRIEGASKPHRRGSP